MAGNSGIYRKHSKHVIAYKLDLIAQEIEKDLADVSQQQLSDQTMFVLCSALVYVNSKDLLQLLGALKMLSELHPELVPSLNVTIANAVVLYALTQKDDSERVLSELKEEFGSNCKIISKLQECLFQKPIPDDWDSMLESMVLTLLGNVVSLVRKLIAHTSGIVPAGIDATSLVSSGTETKSPQLVLNKIATELPLPPQNEETSSTSNATDNEDTGTVDTHHEGTTDNKQDESSSMKDVIDESLVEESHSGQDESPPNKVAMAASRHNVSTDDEDNTTMLSLQKRLADFSPEEKHLDISLESDVEISSPESFSKVPALDNKAPPLKNSRHFWNVELTNELIKGINRFGVGKWAQILRRGKFPYYLSNNTLRYKWRNLTKYNYVTKEGTKWILN